MLRIVSASSCSVSERRLPAGHSIMRFAAVLLVVYLSVGYPLATAADLHGVLHRGSVSERRLSAGHSIKHGLQEKLYSVSERRLPAGHSLDRHRQREPFKCI